MKRLILAGVVAALFLSTAAHAATVHVDAANQTGTENGSTLRPYASLAAAVAAADSGDELRIARGAYAGPVRVEGKVLRFLGGHVGGTTASYAGGTPGNFSARDPLANPTFVNGVASNSTILLIEAGASVLDGLTITGGGGAREDAFRTQGGGVYISGGAPTITACTITGNDSFNPEQPSFGGAIFSASADLTLTFSTLAGNTSGRGAGIAVSDGTVVIRGNTIRDNIGKDDHGGGIYAFSPNVTIEDNDIFGNEIGRDLGYGWGGGIIIFNMGASATIHNNRIHHNYAPSRGAGVFIDEGATAVMTNTTVYANESVPDAGVGGVYVDPGQPDEPSHITIRHCTIYGHRHDKPTLGGNGLFVEGACTALVENSIIWGNDGYSIWAANPGNVTVRYSSTEEAYAGPGNRTGDPLLADGPGGDLHLRSTKGRWNPATSGWVLDAQDSPCIDAADPASPFANEPQGNGARANMGAYGNTNQASRTALPSEPAVVNGLVVR